MASILHVFKRDRNRIETGAMGTDLPMAAVLRVYRVPTGVRTT